MPSKKNYKPPENSKGDIAHKVVRSGLAAIPFIGGSAVELFTSLIIPPIEKRRIEWMEMVGKSLKKLEEKNYVTISELREDNNFIDTVLQASQVALRTSQKDKINALKNAILNSCLPEAPDKSKQHLFIDLIDTFTEWHIRILKLFDNPRDWFTNNNVQWPNLYMGGLSSILELAYSEMKGNREFYDLIWKDLYNKGLVNTDSLHVTMSKHGLEQRRTNEMGLQFLKYIASPL
ncbi:MAG: hypothetical protein GF353_13220 [Candidatus Lokiarchaeota archaeon]|nr:hypothetical protein [Candidatus Lokiarchaeota archaeon]